MQTTRIRSTDTNWMLVGRQVGQVTLNILTTLLAIGFMFPFLWSLFTSLKTPVEITAFPPSLLPKVPKWGNYAEAWTSIQFSQFFLNSAIVTVAAVVGTIVSSLLVAYGFARLRFPGREILFLICLSGMMMPAYVTIIPLFLMFRAIHWIDTLKPLIVPSFFGGAFGIFFMRQFIMTIPLELDESALIDGASRLGILIKIIAPNCKTAMAALAVFSFMGSWNNFLGPLIFLNSVEKFTLPLGLWFFRSYAGDPNLPKDHLLMAGSIITTLPVLIVFASAQRYFVQGIVMSGIKG
jgi:ABC-type glycerol-3-phosphate transport system permease component